MSYCKDRVAVVTGAGGTLCSVIAAHLAELGAKVVLVGRTCEKLEKVACGIAASGGVCRIEPADVTDEAATRDMAERIASEWGPCRLLVNGAGGNNVKAMPTRLRFSEKDLEVDISHKEHKDFANSAFSAAKNDLPADRGFFDIDMEAFKSVLEINTLGTVIPSRIFALQMAKAGGGWHRDPKPHLRPPDGEGGRRLDYKLRVNEHVQAAHTRRALRDEQGGDCELDDVLRAVHGACQGARQRRRAGLHGERAFQTVSHDAGRGPVPARRTGDAPHADGEVRGGEGSPWMRRLAAR